MKELSELPVQRTGDAPPIYRARVFFRRYVIEPGATCPRDADIYGVRSDITIGYPHTQDGTSLCRWCYGTLPPRRHSWCSNECVREYQQRFSWPDIRRSFLQRFERTCQHCGFQSHPDETVLMELDHITPVVEGGDNRPDNLRLLCADCHKIETRKLTRRRFG